MKGYLAFIEYLQFEKRTSAHTVLSYKTDLEQFFLFIKLTFDCDNVAKITHQHIRSWLASLKEKGLENKSILRKTSSLKSYFKFCLLHNIIEISPTQKIISPKLKNKLPIFVREQELVNTIEETDFEENIKGETEKLLIILLYETGMRRNEIINLSISNINFYTFQLKILGKGNKERIIPIRKKTIELIKEYILLRSEIEQITHDFLFVLKTGKQLYPEFVYRIVTKHLGNNTTLNKKSPHILRHSFATHLLNNGAELNAIKELLGHSSLAATQIYTHNSIEELKNIHKKAHPKA
ncbi:MAG: tyrosine-type recombinase/integrase [Chitinophagaceae bacterium]|nr:tyrosine-type recombinase/integrase [Chitinophagaceae bacterium]